MSITLNGTTGIIADSPATVKANAYLDAAGGNTATINGMTPVGTTATQTLTNKSIDASQLTGSIASAQMGSSGSAPVYACRAWMNYDGIGLSMRGSGNIASVTNPATGRYVVTFTTAMPDANYSVVLGGSVSDNASNPWQDFGSIARAFTTTGFIIDCAAQGTTAAGQANWAIITAAVFR